MNLVNDNTCSWINDLVPRTNIKTLQSNEDCEWLIISASYMGLSAAIKQSCEDQKKGITTFIEVILNQELGEPFRRDAMKKPVKVAGINKEDMKKNPSLNS